MKEGTTGCWNCKHLEWYEAYFEENSDSGYICEYRDNIDKFKTFPCKRKLKCFTHNADNMKK